MKTCPVCKARCFDDMAVCYGCLHDFSRQVPSDAHGVCSCDERRPSAGFGDSSAASAAEAADASCGFAHAFEPVDPPWFSPCDPFPSRDLGEQGYTAYMPIPMVTVVRREGGGECRFLEKGEKGSPVSLELSIPAGGRILLCAR